MRVIFQSSFGGLWNQSANKNMLKIVDKRDNRSTSVNAIQMSLELAWNKF